MPFYHKLGDIPNKRHTVFKSESGKHRYEELFGTIGFVGMSSLVYHTQRPTQVKEILNTYSISPKAAIENNLKSMMLVGFNIEKESDFLKSRKVILFNNNCQISLASPTKSQKEYFYKNTDSD